ncbi:hypothetical protein ACA910_005205 [Epithemia clementina (nom. ined.)]
MELSSSLAVLDLSVLLELLLFTFLPKLPWTVLCDRMPHNLRNPRINASSRFPFVSINPTLYWTEMADRFVGGNMDIATAFAKINNPIGRPG